MSEFLCDVPPRVARQVLPSQRSVQPPGVPVGIAGYVGEDVAYRPVGEPARASDLLIGDAPHCYEQS